MPLIPGDQVTWIEIDGLVQTGTFVALKAADSDSVRPPVLLVRVALERVEREVSAGAVLDLGYQRKSKL